MKVELYVEWYRSAGVLNAQLLAGDEVVEFSVLFLLDAAERVDDSVFRFHLEIEGAGRAPASGKVDAGDFFKSADKMKEITN